MMTFHHPNDYRTWDDYLKTKKAVSRNSSIRLQTELFTIPFTPPNDDDKINYYEIKEFREKLLILIFQHKHLINFLPDIYYNEFQNAVNKK